MEAVDTGAPISVPASEGMLGRMINVTGEPIDRAGPIPAADRWPIHHRAPDFIDVVPAGEVLETGIKVIDLMTPVCQGRQDRPVRRRRRGQDRAHRKS
ncbi:MAG: hypothetical protein ACLUN6_04075 [Holdemanella sp.]|uniref:hypothetical protein n=1 Tax=Holdemanella sp. TaxID=1971762 RepID=UPI003994777A